MAKKAHASPPFANSQSLASSKLNPENDHPIMFSHERRFTLSFLQQTNPPGGNCGHVHSKDEGDEVVMMWTKKLHFKEHSVVWSIFLLFQFGCNSVLKCGFDQVPVHLHIGLSLLGFGETAAGSPDSPVQWTLHDHWSFFFGIFIFIVYFQGYLCLLMLSKIPHLFYVKLLVCKTVNILS